MEVPKILHIQLEVVIFHSLVNHEIVQEFVLLPNGEYINTARVGNPENPPMVLLHGFIKKTQKTPKVDLNLALKRKKEVT